MFLVGHTCHFSRMWIRCRKYSSQVVVVALKKLISNWDVCSLEMFPSSWMRGVISLCMYEREKYFSKIIKFTEFKVWLHQFREEFRWRSFLSSWCNFGVYVFYLFIYFSVFNKNSRTYYVLIVLPSQIQRYIWLSFCCQGTYRSVLGGARVR